MELISITDFVLEQKGDNLKYAQFLKQYLNLGMFVPCVDNEVLEEPLNYNKWIKKELNTPYDLDLSKYEQYKQAKERVLFEGFRIENCTITNDIICIGEGLTLYHTIEDLLIDFKGDITLTKSAQKQLGL